MHLIASSASCLYVEVLNPSSSPPRRVPLSKCLFFSFQTSTNEHRINAKEINNPQIELLYHETTQNFDKLPIQYRVSPPLSYLSTYFVLVMTTFLFFQGWVDNNWSNRLFEISREFIENNCTSRNKGALVELSTTNWCTFFHLAVA